MLHSTVYDWLLAMKVVPLAAGQESGEAARAVRRRS